MSRIDEVLGEIAEADAGDWPRFVLEDEGKVVHTCSWNTSWRLERHGIHQDKRDFSEGWTDVFREPCTADTVYVYHDSSPIYSKRVVLVDGARAVLPTPTNVKGAWKISELEEKIGAILTGDAKLFYDKLNRANVEVTDDTIRPRYILSWSTNHP